MNDDTIEIGIWLKIFFVCIFGLGAAIGFFFYFSGNALFSKASGSQASLQFIPNTYNIHAGETIKVQLYIDTNKAPVRGVDVVATFDPTALMLRMVTPIAQKDTELKAFLPLDSSSSFDFTKVIASANSNGRIEFSALTADVITNKLRSPVNGNFVLAELEFLVKREVNSTVTILKTHPTKDSTVVEDANPPANILSRVNTLFLLAPAQSVTPLTQQPTP